MLLTFLSSNMQNFHFSILEFPTEKCMIPVDIVGLSFTGTVTRNIYAVKNFILIFLFLKKLSKNNHNFDDDRLIPKQYRSL